MGRFRYDDLQQSKGRHLPFGVAGLPKIGLTQTLIDTHDVTTVQGARALVSPQPSAASGRNLGGKVGKNNADSAIFSWLWGLWASWRLRRRC